ncbi:MULTISPECIES: hypothetical protein [Acinetobacter]|uniref:Uncharacterized protein n=1 Tax=Acinetobacter ursingii TaxID=108980 RepID=A0A3D2SLV4_9GAMM|nr:MULTISPECIES: hypothetical protein [Acinetobacter]RSC23229.1 hypothetical protein EGS47_10975 [Acinetobacter sp. FDAARGOS_515]VTX85865.1 Uncharacterised protein [Acinetobacter ursingii]HCK29782.1 hypothetical protein [Acinetobacter ursingii]
MPTKNLQLQKQNRDNIIAVRVTDSELELIEKAAYESRKKKTRVLLDAFLEKCAATDCKA